ncbi:MAG: NAD(P)H-binding protein [Chloroflexi bacterium]|nr:NAD(P)H-binding protein [Chloroflexota bacterium]
MVLILGGGGFIGRHLAALLALWDDSPIRVMSRSPSRVFDESARTIAVALEVTERLGAVGRLGASTIDGARARAAQDERTLRAAIEPMEGDIRDVDALSRALEGTDAVVQTVAIIRETADRSFSDTNVGATRGLLAAMRVADVSRLLYLGILGATDDPRLPYARSRFEAEEAVRASGLSYTIVKPSLVLGYPDTFSLRLIQALDFAPPVVMLPNGGRTRFQPIWIGDLAAILALCLRETETVGRVYELGGPDHLTFAHMVRTFARVLGKRRLFLPVPAGLLAPAAAVLGRLMKDPPATATELRQLDTDNVTDLDAVMKQFGFPPARFADYVGEFVAALGK